MEKFKNRAEAGKLLGNALISYQHENPVVVAIPRGGVEIGYYIAIDLNCDLSVIISRKLAFPEQPELAFGAISEDGSIYLDPWLRNRLSAGEISRVKDIETKEMERRVKLYRRGKPLPNLKNRTVIISDDGIATGATLSVAIETCRKHDPKKIVVAAPVASRRMVKKLLNMVDDICILKVPDQFNAVSQVYEHFEGLEDAKVVDFMDRWHEQRQYNQV